MDKQLVGQVAAEIKDRPQNLIKEKVLSMPMNNKEKNLEAQKNSYKK